MAMYVHKTHRQGWAWPFQMHKTIFSPPQSLVRAQEAKIIEEKAAKIKDWVTLKLREVSYVLGRSVTMLAIL